MDFQISGFCRWLSQLLIVLNSLAFAGLCSAEGRTVSPKEAAHLPSNSYTLVDVRTDAEWWLGRVKDAVHIPMSRIRFEAERLLPNKAEPLLLYCGKGKRAQRAIPMFEELGYSVTAVRDGGFRDLVDQGMKIASGSE